MKVCSTCGVEKGVDEFKVGRNQCISCRKEYRKEWRSKNNRHVSKYRKEYDNNNKDKLKKHYIEYREKNKDRINERSRIRSREKRKKWIEENQDLAEKKLELAEVKRKTCSICGAEAINKSYCNKCMNKKAKKYRDDNKEKVKISRKKYDKKRKHSKKEYDKIYTKKNKEKKIKLSREYYQKNKDTVKKRAHEYKKKNKSTIIKVNKTTYNLKTCPPELKPSIEKLINIRNINRDLEEKRNKIKKLKEKRHD